VIDTHGLPGPPDAPGPRECLRIERPEPGLALLVLAPPHRSLAVLDMPLLRDLDLALDEFERDEDLRGLVVTGRSPTSFAAGADIDALASLRDPALVLRVVEIGQRLFERVARLGERARPVRTVAAVGGPVPGGAYELALACSCIVAANAKETKIGLPEVLLGILPAWGGSQRLPRRIGVPAALEAILQGRLYSARDALRRGMVDRLAYPEDLVRIASEIALGRQACPRKDRGGVAKLLVDQDPLATRFIAGQARKKVLAETRGHYPAPLAALEVVARAPHTALEKGFADEARAAAELAVGDVSKNLIAIFRLSEDA
jgi:3-hydroxyacyl-CoA dehydrogenase / enoyl-CoA hydratase / 3-hydroxybutyryl-CoA epimerase